MFSLLLQYSFHILYKVKLINHPLKCFLKSSSQAGFILFSMQAFEQCQKMKSGNTTNRKIKLYIF